MMDEELKTLADLNKNLNYLDVVLKDSKSMLERIVINCLMRKEEEYPR